MPRKKSPPGPRVPATTSPEVAIMQVPPTVRREVAARVVLGVSPSTFDALRRCRPDFPQGMAYGPQCLVFDTAQLLAWRDKHRGLSVDEVPPLKPSTNRIDLRKVDARSLAKGAKELHARTYVRKGPATSKQEAA